MIWDWLRQRPLLIDWALVALLLAVSVVDAENEQGHATAGVVLGVAATLPLLRRRRQPCGVVVVVTAVVLVMAGFDVRLWPIQLGLALYTLAATGKRRTAVVAGVGAVAAVGVALLGAGFDFGDIVASRLVFLAAAWLLGDGVASRRSYLREVELKAERQEQARIARELHDVIAHALSVIVMQAGAADDVFEVDPRRTREPIRAIDAAARAALTDVRRALGMLRHDADYEPQPSLAQLEPLVERVRAVGVQVSLKIEGTARPLPPTVDNSAYRIVQEALTNTLKHADAECIHVRVRYSDELSLEIRDDGRAPANGSSGGNGLIGMRERIALLGGSVEAGSLPGGGYLVAARIPIEEPA